MTGEETERICFNCSYYFPASQGMTEYGICLEKDDFDPYFDEAGNLNYASCQDLIEKKKLLGGNEACENFEEAEIIEIDDESPLGELLKHTIETGEIDKDKLMGLMFEEQFDLTALPVDPYVEMLKNGDEKKQKQVLYRLGTLVMHGNKGAFEALLDYLKALPPPEKIEEVHVKIGILDDLKSWATPDQRARLIPLLIEELYKVASNNTTRQWITKILQYLARAPEDEVRQPLETLLKERKFSFRTQQKIVAVLKQLGREDYF